MVSVTDSRTAELLQKLPSLKYDYEMSGSLEYAIFDIADELRQRIEDLEELIRIMWLYLSDPETEFPCCIPICEELREDMRTLGIEVRDD